MTLSDKMRAAARSMSNSAGFNHQWEHNAVEMLRAGADRIDALTRKLTELTASR